MVLLKNVLIASDDKLVSGEISNSFDSSIEKKVVSTYDECLTQLKKRKFDIIFFDIHLLISTGELNSVQKCEQILNPIYKIFPSAEIIIIAPQEKIRSAVYFVKSGASNYLTFPVDPLEIKLIIERLEQRNQEKQELDYLRDRDLDHGEVLFKDSGNKLMNEVYSKITSVAKTKTTVLLQGESGTGKSMIAGILHNQSIRGDRQFINVHCGAIPDNLIESELFGYEKGAFTGAVKRKIGKFELANNGTIFLDEIGTITASVQIKLLKILQDKTFQRLGGDTDIHTDVRIIAATNANLSDMVKKGEYRNDLYYRLNIFPIEIPPLRKRLDEIEDLTFTFLNNMNLQYQKEIEEIHPLVLEAFHRYDWPGNIRELENLIERAYILESSNCLTPESFPAELFDDTLSSVVHVPLTTGATLAEVRRRTIEDIERQYLKEALSSNSGRINKTAETAGISPRQLHKLLTKYSINKNDYK